MINLLLAMPKSKTKECPSCAMEVDRKDKICPICQYEFPTQPKAVSWVAALLILVILFWLLVF